MPTHTADTTTHTQGGWHLGTIKGKDAGAEASRMLSAYLNTAKSSGADGKYVLVRSVEARRMSRY